ncbi:sugar phosphate isomerase/epimerase family protein [Luteolibacter algae]|uniref:Sugar phosphate isomerase/epimerase family protein n=1 Tax=Luteolibacter algae TaxID=454151 RepID=A0ABW5DA87_9BACT
MKFAICNETFRNHDFAGTCAEATRHGYTGLEVAPFTLGKPETLTMAEAANYGRVIREHGLEVVGLHWLLAHTHGYHLTHPDGKIQSKTFDYARHLAEICSSMGGNIMVWGSPQQRTLEPDWSREEATKRFIDFFQRLSPHLAAADVTIAFEFLGPAETNFINTAAETIELLKIIDSPNVRLHLDVKAMAADDKPIPEIVRESLPWTAHFHANDPNLQGPGMGAVDFQPIADELIAGGYDKWVSVEVFDTEISPETLATESLTNLRKFFA